MKYQHKCKGCTREFIGRKNKEFHDLQCKIDYNNEKAAKIRNQLKDNKIMQKNYLVISEAYSIYKNQAIPFVNLQKRGFDITAPTRQRKTVRMGFVIYLSNGFGFRIVDENGKKFVSIYTEEEIENL